MAAVSSVLLRLFLCACLWYARRIHGAPFKTSSNCTTFNIESVASGSHREDYSKPAVSPPPRLYITAGPVNRQCTLTSSSSDITIRATISSTTQNGLQMFVYDEQEIELAKKLLRRDSSVKYSCSKNDATTTCLLLTMHSNHVLTLRSLSSPASTTSHSSHSPTLAYLALGVVMGIILLSLMIALCVKNSTSSEPTNNSGSQNSGTGNLRVLAGPPPEYIKAMRTPPPEQERATPPSLAGPQEPPNSTDSPDGDQPRKKMATPLPELPKTKDNLDNVERDENEDDEKQESPYDCADGNNKERGRDDQLPPPLPAVGGSYAKVTRHSTEINESHSIPTNGAYFEIREMNGQRARSVTEPVQPSTLLSPPSSIPRTFTGMERIPLPPPPSNEEEPDDTYDSIDLLDRHNDYDLDDEDENEMYESVPESFREELRSISSPTASSPPAIPPLRQHDSGGSPSKHTTEGVLDSPTRRKLVIIKKKRAESASTDEHRLSFFNRIRSSSASASSKKAHETSPDPPQSLSSHPPLPPQPQDDDDEECDDTYDSVQDSLSSSITSRTNSTSHNVPPRHSSRVNEPLPEVPEDSGSSGPTVKRNRELDSGDPNYDIVSRASKEVNTATGYARVVGHHPPNGTSHNNLEYAVVDQSIVKHKRKLKEDKANVSRDEEEEEEEDPYSRVNKDDDEEEEDPYSKVNKDDDEEEEDPYSRVNKDDDEEEEDPYSKVNKDDDEEEEDPYSKVNKDDDEEEEDPYSKVNKDDDEEEEDPYSKVNKDDDEEEEDPYSKVNKDDEEEDPYSKVNKDDEEEEEDPYSKVNKVEDDEEEEDPYSKVNKDDLDEDSHNTNSSNHTESHSTIIKEDEVETVTTEETYAVIDPQIIKHKRAASLRNKSKDSKEISPLSSIPSVSPIPSLPPVGDLGDVSEFIPPPVPPHQMIELDESEDLEVANENIEVANGNTEVANENIEVANSDVIPSKETVSTQEEGSLLDHQDSSSDDGVPVYDSLEPIQPSIYDSLAPVQEDHIYNSLQPIEKEDVEINT